MPRPKQESANYLESVGQILFDPAEMTDHDHFAVIERGVSSKLDTENRRLAYDYARSHITDPRVQADALTFIAINAVDGIRGQQRNNREWVDEENRNRFDEARGVLRSTLKDRLLGSQEATLGSLDLVLELENKLFSFEGEHPIHPGRTKVYYTNVFSRKEYHTADKDEVQAKNELVRMAIACLDAIQYRFPGAAELLSSPLHKQYISQFNLVPHTRLGDTIIGKTLEQIDATTPNAVADILNLAERAESDGARRAAWDRAIDVTKDSDRERPNEVKIEIKKNVERGWFGVKREVERAVEVPSEGLSAFDERLALLTGKLDYGFKLKEMLTVYPEYVKKVVELHDSEQQNEIWQFYADELANLAFTNGSYKISEISEITDTVTRFGYVAPAEMVAQVKQRVQARLAQSTPTIRGY